MPSEFRKRYDTLVQDSSYKTLRKWLAGDKGVAILFLGLKLIDKMPADIKVPPEAFYLVLFSICIAIAPLLFFIRKDISFGNYLIAIRLAAISTFYLIFGFATIIPDTFQYKYLITIFIFVIISFTLIFSIFETINNFHLNRGFGWYVLAINVISYAFILPLPLSWIL